MVPLRLRDDEIKVNPWRRCHWSQALKYSRKSSPGKGENVCKGMEEQA